MAELVGPIQHKRGTTAEWAASTIPLRDGELGIDTTVRRMKVGDGSTLFPSLPWQDVDQATIDRLEAAATALADGVSVTDAAMTNVQADADSTFAKAQKATFGAVTLITAFGAVGDGVTDDSAAFAAALAAVPSGGTLQLPHGRYVLPDVYVTRSDVNIMGPGTVIGRITIGQLSSTTDFFSRGVYGVRFERTGPVSDPTFAGIRVRNAKRLRIEQCWFYNMSSAIYTESSTGNDVANLNIIDNEYQNVGYFLRSVTGSGAVWRSHADVNLVLNRGNARIAHVKMDSVDGLRATNNRMFFFGNAAQDPQKERHFDIGFSDWITIKDNELFEAGLESIYLEDPNHFVVVDNNIAWPSQRANRDAISITVGVGRSGDSTAPPRADIFGTVGGGDISQWAKNAVGFYGTGRVDHVVVLPTSLERASGNPPTYYGTDTLGTPRRVYVAGTLTALNPQTPPYIGDLAGTVLDEFRGRATASERWLHSRAKELAIPTRDTTITSKTTLYILRDLNQQSTTTTALSGRIHLDVRNAGTLARSATYELLVGASPDGTRTCQVLGAVGSYTNTAGGPTNAPAFTFGVEHNGTNIVLTATPIGATSGAFSYSAVSTGSLILG